MARRRNHAALPKNSSDAVRSIAGQTNGHPPLQKKTTRRNPVLLAYHELPAWYQDNKHILHGYRPESLSTTACLWSWTYLHNESFNIHSHLIPVLALALFCSQAVSLPQLQQAFPEAQPLDHAVFALLLVSACITLSLSVLYHTMLNHSMAISYLWLRLDYVGILVLTLADFISGIRVGFYCDPRLQKIYWTMVYTHQPPKQNTHPSNFLLSPRP
jgi:adiponectin receptor